VRQFLYFVELPVEKENRVGAELTRTSELRGLVKRKKNWGGGGMYSLTSRPKEFSVKDDKRIHDDGGRL